MADIRSCFPILADDITGAGECAISRVEGEAAAAKEGLIGFSFKDASGNVVLPQLTALGAIPVDTEGVNFTCLDSEGEVTSPTAVDTEDTVATITLANSTTYQNIWASVCNSRWTLYRVYHVDDVGGAGTENDLGWLMVGPGQYTVCCEMTCKEFATGAVGTQELRIGGTPLHTASTLRGSLSVREIAA